MISWIAHHRSTESEDLQKRHPNAFLLLCQIARRARLTPCPITGLKIGQAFVGDFKRAGLSSERTYRTAKEILKKCHFATFNGTTKGTVATLMKQGIFSLSLADETDTPTSDRRASDGQPTTKIKRNTENKDIMKSICTPGGEILDAIWQKTPARGRERSSREKLKSAWSKIPAPDRPTKETVEAALDAWGQSKSWTDQDGQFVPAIHRWVTDKQWENTPTNTPTKKPQTKLDWEP